MDEPMNIHPSNKREFLDDLIFGSAGGMDINTLLSRQDPELDKWIAENIFYILNCLGLLAESEEQAKSALILILLGTNLRKQVDIFELNKALGATDGM